MKDKIKVFTDKFDCGDDLSKEIQEWIQSPKNEDYEVVSVVTKIMQQDYRVVIVVHLKKIDLNPFYAEFKEEEKRDERGVCR